MVDLATRLQRQMQTAIDASAMAQRVPHNGFYATVRDRAIHDLTKAIADGQEALEEGDANWVKFWMDAGRRRVRLVKALGGSHAKGGTR